MKKQSKVNDKKLKKLSSKLQEIATKNNTDVIALSEYLNNITVFNNMLNSKNLSILDGRWLFNYIVFDIVQYISEKQQKDISKQNISILVNNVNETVIENILILAKKVKSLNIVTNNINKFKKIEEYLCDELGIIVRVTNNKRKSLQKTELIINIDFPEELINKFNIYDKAIIINIWKKISIRTKKFNGINVNYYKLEILKNYEDELKKYEIYDEFNKEILCESILFKKSNFDNIRKQIQDNIKIEHLIGNNGKINDSEFLDLCIIKK